jgi:CHAD domain-containing protein
MASVTTLPGSARPQHRGFTYWMARVRKELDCLRNTSDDRLEDSVHDLRVAIRRCRSLAAVMLEVDPNPAWRQLRKLPRKLFRGLGSLRDAHVLHDWLERLTPEGDSVRTHLLEMLQKRAIAGQSAAHRTADKFDEEKWKRVENILRQRVRIVPPGGLAAECLVLERFEEAHELHARALRTKKPRPWHQLRIGLKRFRYAVENLLPRQHAAWEDGLKRVQDVLGDLHDLDVLASLLRDESANLPLASIEALRQALERERNERIQTYRQLTLGQAGLWHLWRAGLPRGARVGAAAFARLRATARALDSRPRRTARLSRLALRLFDALTGARATPQLRDPAARRIFRAALLLQGIGSYQDRKPQQKVARSVLLRLGVPPGWSATEWELLVWAIRYHRGAEPKPKHADFAALPEDRRHLVQLLAGILRLARALGRCGVEHATGLRAEASEDLIVLTVPGWVNNLEHAERLAAGKHLLELALHRSLIVEPLEKVVPLARETENELTEIAAASD